MKKMVFAVIVAATAIGCQTPRTSYTNGVVFWTSSTAFGLGYGEYIEVAPGGKLERSIKGEKDTLTLAIDNTQVKEETEKGSNGCASNNSSNN